MALPEYTSGEWLSIVLTVLLACFSIYGIHTENKSKATHFIVTGMLVSAFRGVPGVKGDSAAGNLMLGISAAYVVMGVVALFQLRMAVRSEQDSSSDNEQKLSARS